ncbi:MAG: hypothetical protein NZ992_06820 [Candidatus Korarchaeum sp.]|nr:hypothetical protein [Candidatus Korarchaeum sp.]MDW8034867.1 hypothetical protein [Candidatus Korarchaeum sp.]
MGGLDEVEEILEGEGIDYRRVKNAVITSFREGELSYTLIVLSNDDMTVIVGKTDPPFIPTEEMAYKLLEESFRTNFASYHLSEDNEVVVTSFLKTRCIKQSFMRNFYAVLSSLRKLGEHYAS